MAAQAFRVETAYVRGCARTYVSEIGFSPRAETQMSAARIDWPSVHQALRGGRVVWSDKEDAADTMSIVVGTDCDGNRLRVTISWSGARYSLLVLSVERL
jgi:hypothetical protein